MKAFVIRLKNIETSEALADDCVKSGLKHGLIIEKFDGIYGNIISSYLSDTLKIKQGPAKMKKKRLGVLGCLASHYTLWKHSVENNEIICIFEHDGILLRPIPCNIESLFDEFLLLDPYNKFSQAYENQHLKKLDNNFTIIDYNSPDSRKKYNVKSEYAMGLQAYIIKPKAAKKLIKYISVNGFVPADMQCNKDIINLQTTQPACASINKIFYNNKEKMLEMSTTHRIW